jgi:hypothetical protein
MLNQVERLQNFKANADQVEQESWSRAYSEAREMLKKGFCERFVANKCLISIKDVKRLKEEMV